MRLTGGLLLLAALALLMLPQPGHAACSAAPPSGYAGRISINEYNMIGTNTPTGTDFVELKVLDSTLLTETSNLTGFKLRVYRNSAGAGGGTSCTPSSVKCVFYETSLNSIVVNTYNNTSNDYCQGTSGKNTYIRIPYASGEMQKDSNVVLLDPSGNVVDLLRVTDAKSQAGLPKWWADSTASPISCSTYTGGGLNVTTSGSWPFDTDVWSIDANRKNLQRLPDGLGPWTQSPGNGANSEDTLCTTNDNILLITKTPITTTYNSYSPGLNGYAQYLITVTNGAASSSQSGITVTENLTGTGLTYVSGMSTVTQGSVTGTTSLSWAVGTLAAGASASWTLTTIAGTTNLIGNTVSASSSELAGGFTQATAYINSLLTTMTADTTSTGVGSNVTYTVTVKNQTAGSLAGVSVAMPVPSGMNLVSGTATPWNIGTLAAGATATTTVTLSPTAAGSYTYTATATSTSVAGSYPASATVSVANPAAFSIDVPNFKAGDGAQATITAPQSGGAPVTGFSNTTRKVKFYYVPVTPSSGASGTMKMDAWEGATNTSSTVGNVAGSLGTAVTRDVYFDANGVGHFDINYDNVGQFTIYADWQGSYETSPPVGAPSSVTGSDSFVVSPYQYDLVPSVTSAAGGSSFDITVTAQAICKDPWAYTGCTSGFKTATNFAGSAATDVTVEMDGTGLNNNPALSCYPETATCKNDGVTDAVLPASSFTGGVATISGVYWGEVGTSALKATSNYLGSGSASNTDGSAHFYPARFSGSGDVASHGGNYIYFGEPGLDITETIAAQISYKDATGATAYRTAQNYSSDSYDAASLATVKSRSLVSSTALDVYSSDATPVKLTNTGAAACTWTNGLCTLTSNDASLQRDSTTPSAPKTVDFSVELIDNENKVTSCTHVNTCSVSGNQMIFDYGSIEARYGRLRVLSGQGSDRTGYTAQVVAEYCKEMSGSICTLWSRNVDDNTTTLSAGNVGVSGVSAPVLGVTGIKGGLGTIILGPPGAAGQLQLCLDLASGSNGCTTATTPGTWSYLLGNWGVSTFTRDTNAVIQFGRPALPGYIYMR